jgi:hypothetical protein
MKINFKDKFSKDYKGEVMVLQNGEKQSIKDVICQCLFVGDPSMSADEKYKSYKLSQILLTTDEADLTSEDISLIKKVCAKCINGAGGYGQVCDVLEGRDTINNKE